MGGQWGGGGSGSGWGVRVDVNEELKFLGGVRWGGGGSVAEGVRWGGGWWGGGQGGCERNVGGRGDVGYGGCEPRIECIVQCTKRYCGERTGLVVRASDSGSGDPGSILGRVGVLFP